MHKYIIMGAQGCGKGTQAKLLTKDLDLVHISVGDIFRWNIQTHTKLAARIKRIVASGQLVPDEIVEDIIRQRLEEHDWNYGFILDGFPRSTHQAEFFLESFDIDAVINIEVPDEEVMKRIMSRRLCSQCGLDYNVIYHRPEVENVCDICGSILIVRADDTKEAIKKRLNDYYTKTQPTLDLFRKKELVISIDGTQLPDDVQKQIRQKLSIPLREII
jgi:adenylate kinase